MDSTPGSVLVIFLLVVGTDGDSVDQTGGLVSLIEGAVLTLNCTYESSAYPVLFWYIQYPREAPQLLLRDTAEKDRNSFYAEHDKNAKSFHLRKHAIVLGDSALYYCALSDTVTRATEKAAHKLTTGPAAIWNLGRAGRVNGQMKLEQSPPYLRIQEGESLTLHCKSSSTLSILLWYRQDPQKGPQALVTLVKPNEVKHQGRLTARFDEKRQNSSLLIRNSQPRDSATYLWVRGLDKVEQIPPSLSIQEGENGTMNCSFTNSAFETLQWYRQDPGKGPTFLFLIRSNEKRKPNGRFTATLEKDDKRSSLFIRDSQPGDSATYLCAVGPQ
ncbi:uncharacterized protein LOC119920837 [Tachyglossus aculeatus]|uniref:uncharacterized protein LOC119920837 n=1 Tax=Tachyglossus aculeatus TaxID=9261 RepID=UPI0018F75E19|nr:uncharacterized protein LOC119920837 [Tachyglossus aculeatus]